jgi:lysophospholipase L1-like esterase
MKTKGFSKILIIVIIAVLIVLGVIVFKQMSEKNGRTGIISQPLTAIKKNSQERKFVALGASTTKANNLSQIFIGDNPEYSFATGTKIESLYLYLKEKGENLTAVNLAESGANSKSVLQKQVPNAITYYPKYITIDIMADILEDSSPANLKRNLQEIISKIKGEETIILISSYPNFPLLRSASYSACKEDKLQVGFDKLTPEKIQSFNQALQEMASENDLIFVDLYSILTPSDVSDYDCVHPNIEGQKKLAKAWIKALEEGR